jgi:3-deoxy-D-manno-octulosonate 8-phosphate phosphatase (KDO 8-P phosphatase)
LFDRPTPGGAGSHRAGAERRTEAGEVDGLARAAVVALDDLAQDRLAQKLPALARILERRGVSFEECAFVGDDFPDMAVLRRVGLPVAVGNAVPEVRAVAKLRLQRDGGRGAVREFAEILLKARGEWDAVTQRYVAERSVLHAGAGA